MSNIYQQAVPVVTHKIANLKHLVELGLQHARDNELDEGALTGFRLFPDMLPFAAQIRIATDLACGMTSRLSGKERISLDDSASNFEELLSRLNKTLQHLREQNEADYEGSGERDVTIKTPFGELNFKGTEYLMNFLYPNLYFHIVTPYNMLRTNGVKVGKIDYMRGAAQ